MAEEVIQGPALRVGPKSALDLSCAVGERYAASSAHGAAPAAVEPALHGDSAAEIPCESRGDDNAAMSGRERREGCAE